MTPRGTSYLEALIILALILVLVGAVVVPAYRSYSASRASRDAATTLAEDIALLERAAQNGRFNEGSSLIIVSENPFIYQCYDGRPSYVDPNSKLESLIVERSFPGVVLTGGPINSSTPLLFASNGSAQYAASGAIAPQHQIVEFSLTQKGGGKIAKVDLDLFTGSVTTP